MNKVIVVRLEIHLDREKDKPTKVAPYVRSRNGKLVVNFWTRLKVRDIAAARPVARPIIVIFWYFLFIIFFTFLCW